MFRVFFFFWVFFFFFFFFFFNNQPGLFNFGVLLKGFCASGGKPTSPRCWKIWFVVQTRVETQSSGF